MKVDILSASTLKITLSSEDMINYDLKYDKLCRPEDNRRAVSQLFSLLRRQSPEAFRGNSFTADKRLLVEAFPRYDGGCMLYVSALRDCRVECEAEAESLVCSVSSLDELEGLCRLLEAQRTRTGMEFSAQIYQGEGEYRLLITPKNVCHQLIRRFCAEYGTVLEGETAVAATREYCREIV